ncbi:MAG: PASTA domain-containing protein [Cyclobacteriaceae bacterium]|nr:PASTA domain-containing protein [Cyclobacteriaceae bacterium]
MTALKKILRTGSLKDFLIHLLIIILFGVCLTLVFFYVYLPSTTNHGETITVPSLVELNYNELEEVLVQRNLRFEVSDSMYSAEHPPLTVMRQYPKAGSKVKEGRKIFISVNRNTVPTVALTQIKDKSLTHLKAVLENNDIKIGERIRKSSPYFNLVLEVQYNGRVLEEGDLVPKGATVDVVVGDGYGKRSFELPDFFANEFEVADVILKGLDLNLEPLNLPAGKDTTDQVLYVVRQEPTPGTIVNIGEWVEFWLDTEIDSSFYFEKREGTILMDTTNGVVLIDTTFQSGQ